MISCIPLASKTSKKAKKNFEDQTQSPKPPISKIYIFSPVFDHLELMILKYSFAIVWNFKDMSILAYLAWPKKTHMWVLVSKIQPKANEYHEFKAFGWIVETFWACGFS